MLSRLRSKKGFTLIELMIVVAIIGILAAIAIPNFLRFQAKSKQSEAKTNLGGIHTAQTSYFSEKNRYGSFTEIAWAPVGTTQRYTFYSGSDGAGGGGTSDVKAPPSGTAITWAGTVTPGQQNDPATGPVVFTAGAIGNIDSDAAFDIWTINDAKDLRNVSDDVTA